MVKKIGLCLLILFCKNYCHSQVIATYFDVEAQRYKGHVLLSNGQRYDGLVKNNHKTGVVSIKNESDSTQRTVRYEQIHSMEYFDPAQQISRKFISLETKDVTQKEKDILLFEIVKEFEDFAILSLQGDVVVVETPRNDIHMPQVSPTGMPMGNSSWNDGKTILSQTETLFFLNQEGEREYFASIINTYKKGLLESTKTKVDLNTKVPPKYFGATRWEDTVQHFKNKGLKIKDKETLFDAIDYISLN